VFPQVVQKGGLSRTRLSREKKMRIGIPQEVVGKFNLRVDFQIGVFLRGYLDNMTLRESPNVINNLQNRQKILPLSKMYLSKRDIEQTRYRPIEI
jgi:hypothetical protein